MERFAFIISILTLLTSCSDKKTEGAKEERREQVQANLVTLTDLQIKTAGIEVSIIELKNLKTSIKANGMLTVPNQNKALITSVNRGIIKTLLIQPGNFVKKGQSVATIINPDIATLQQELQTTNAQISLAEIELNRQQELVQGNAAPLKNVQRMQTELATRRATRNALQKQLNTMGISVASVTKGNIITTISITAPISGTVSSVSAQIGSSVDPSAPIAEIVNNSQLHLDLFVYEKDLAKLHPNQIIHFTLTNDPGREYDAQIYSIGTAFASESKTIPVHAVVNGDKAGLIEGMNITAVISIGEAVVPAVPNDAIVTYQGQDFIFVRTDTKPRHADDKEPIRKEANETEKENTEISFERTPVIRGASDIGYTEISLFNKLPPNSKIITKGAFFANAKLTNTGEHEE